MLERMPVEKQVNPLYKERVHIAFLGWEVERIVRPVLEMRGNRLVLICFPKEEENAWDYLVEIKRQLDEKGIPVEIIQESLYKLVEILSILNKVFQVERLKGNEIFINVSAGTKISACASTIAAMAAKDVTAYYVHMETYYPKDNPAFKKENPLQPLTEGFKDTSPLPECQISLPDQKYIKTLHAIKKMQEKGHTKVYIKDLIDFLKEQSVINVKPNTEPRKETSSEYMAIKAIMEKLVGWNYLTISPKKRNRFVELTEKGKNAIDMYLSFDLDATDLKANKDASIVDWIDLLKKQE
jgi:predicted transcriptional regulator